MKKIFTLCVISALVSFSAGARSLHQGMKKEERKNVFKQKAVAVKKHRQKFDGESNDTKRRKDFKAHAEEIKKSRIISGT